MDNSSNTSPADPARYWCFDQIATQVHAHHRTSTATSLTSTTATVTSTVYAVASSGLFASAINYYIYNLDPALDEEILMSKYLTDDIKIAICIESGQLAEINFKTDRSQIVVLMQGFFVAPQTGLYTITSLADHIDKWGSLWKNDAAYQWPNGLNYEASRTGRSPTATIGGSMSFTLNAGDAIPMTLFFANGVGNGNSSFAITTPDGVQRGQGDSGGFFVPLVPKTTPSSIISARDDEQGLFDRLWDLLAVFE